MCYIRWWWRQVHLFTVAIFRAPIGLLAEGEKCCRVCLSPLESARTEKKKVLPQYHGPGRPRKVMSSSVGKNTKFTDDFCVKPPRHPEKNGPKTQKLPPPVSEHASHVMDPTISIKSTNGAVFCVLREKWFRNFACQCQPDCVCSSFLAWNV